ncbi:MAG: ADP-heptose--LPS heptosyltransferase RfaF, partial [Flavobacteriaceae bacterium]|nr:ADP-heptose--LPS heptosyltransferase RfaF [Flavobacteriaceae bacterium]
WASKWENVVSVAGRLTFQNELALLSNIDVMLAMDSGNGHLAAMMGAKVVTLWGVTHPYAGFVPFGQPMANQLTANRDLYPLVPTSVYGKTFPAGYQHAIESIPVEKVIARISEILAN